jgi:hypothetical protein
VRTGGRIREAMRMSTKSILLDRIMPKLKQGQAAGFVRLEARDCEALMMILSQSVDIEPLLTCFHALIKETILLEKPENRYLTDIPPQDSFSKLPNDEDGFPPCKYLFQERRKCSGFVMAMNGSQNECENRSNSGKCHSAAAMTIWREKEDIHG